MQSLPEDPSKLYHRVVRSAIAWVLGYALLAALIPGTLAFAAAFGNGDYLFAGLALIVPLFGFYLNAVALRSILRRHAYPKKYWERAGGCLGTVNRLALVAATIAATFTVLIVRWEHAVVIAAIAYGFILLLFLVGPLEVYRTVHDVHFAPYFESKVGGLAYCAAMHLAQHMEELDELARLHGVTPLSEFGWNDDLKGELNVWYDPLNGMKTVNILLTYFAADEFARSNKTAIQNELKALDQALARASDRRIRFCLLLFCGEATNEMKEARRTGSFF
jgi:hypothetical protein